MGYKSTYFVFSNFNFFVEKFEFFRCWVTVTYVKKDLAQNIRPFLRHLETTPESKITLLESEFDALSEYVSNASVL